MFRPVPMLHLELLVLERDERAVLQEFGQTGAVQLARRPAVHESLLASPRARSEELARCTRLLARTDELRHALEIASPLPAQPIPITMDEAERKIGSMEGRVGIFLKQRKELVERSVRLTSDCERVSSYLGLEIPLGEVDQYSFLCFVAGTLPAKNLARLQSEVPEGVALLPLSEREDRRPLIAMTTRQGQATLESVLRRAGFERDSIPAVEGLTTDSLFENSDRERQEISGELDQLSFELHALANDYAQPLAEIEASATIERRLLEAEQNFPRTEAAVLISGWMPASEAPEMEARVRQIVCGRCVIKSTAPDNSSEEQTPVLLRHPRWLRPFEMLVAAYGLPRYHELEPTVFVAISYVLMFGIMFGDAGHGAVLVLIGLIGLLSGRAQKVRDVGLLLLFGGLSSMAFGLVYGSCFGLESFKKFALWHDPLAGNPMVLMYGAIVLGVVMISLGLVMNIINRFRRGDIIGGFLDKFGIVGVLFYWGALLLIAKFAAIESRGLVGPAIALFLVLPIAGWSLKVPIEYFAHRRTGRSADPGEGFFAATTESLACAFEAVLSYLANTISFVRLAAYAMSHAALLAAAFMMANEVRKLPAGGALSVLVIAAGNLAAILIEGIIASVQALRLEYYEFFGKFFSGNGQPFEPFRLTAIKT